jgi:hypothetical protein
MPGQQAKLISGAVQHRMLLHVARNYRTPARDRIMILLSVRAGLSSGDCQAYLVYGAQRSGTGR